MIDPGFLLVLIGLSLAGPGTILVARVMDRPIKAAVEGAMDWLIRPMGRPEAAE